MHYERVSLARRGGSWRMSYRAVYDAEHKGDRKWATIGAAANRAEAEHLAAEYLYNLPRDPEDERRAAAIEATVGHMPTVGELRRDDIDHALSVGAIEKSTYTGYCQHVRRLGDLGEIPVDRVTAQDVQLYIDSLVEDGYCSETVNLMLWTVRETLELASFRMLRPPLDLRRIRAPKHDRPLPHLPARRLAAGEVRCPRRHALVDARRGHREPPPGVLDVRRQELRRHTEVRLQRDRGAARLALGPLGAGHGEGGRLRRALRRSQARRHPRDLLGQLRGRPSEDPHGIRRLIFPTNMSHHGKEAQKRE